MIGPEFAVVLGVSLLAFAFVPAAYVVWIRIVGLEPTLGQRYATFTSVTRTFVALALGACLGMGAELAPTVGIGVSAAIMTAAATFAGLILFESFAQRSIDG